MWNLLWCSVSLAALLGGCSRFSGYHLAGSDSGYHAPTAAGAGRDAGAGEASKSVSDAGAPKGDAASSVARDGGHDAGALPSSDAGHDASIQIVSPQIDAGNDAAMDGSDGNVIAVPPPPSAACQRALTGMPPSTRCIETCVQLDAMRSGLGNSYALAQDLDCTGFSTPGSVAFFPIGTESAPFRGELHGLGHGISAVVVDTSTDASHGAEVADGVGLFGTTAGAHIDDLALSASVTGSASAGVLAGHALQGTIVSGVSVRGTVVGLDLAGGIVGELVGSIVRDSYASASVSSGTSHAGLLIGSMSAGAELVNSYSIGTLATGTGVLVADRMLSSVLASFFDCDHAGGCNASDPSALHSLELEVPERWLYAGWDFKQVWGTPRRSTVYTLSDGSLSDVPYLQLSPPCLRWEARCEQRPVPDVSMAGDGRTTSSPFQIHTCAQLQSIDQNLVGRYALQNDIDCAGFDAGDGLGFSPLGSALEPFGGVLEGNGYRIVGLRIVRPRRDGVGLIGHASGASVLHVKVARAAVMGGVGVGVLIGNAQRTHVTECEVAGHVAARHEGGATIGVTDSATQVQATVEDVTVSNFQ
jgi:hypothetical protein